MQYDAYLQLDGIECESSDEKHSNWIEVLAFKFGVIQPSEGPASGSGAGGYGRAQFKDFSIIKRLAKSTANIHKAAAAGTNIGTATFEVCRATGEKQTVLQIKFKNLMVADVETNMNIEPNAQITDKEASALNEIVHETVHFKYGEISVTYTQIDHATGASKGNVSYGWNLTTNQAAS